MAEGTIGGTPISDLPDSAFACVDDAGRHYPHHNADGALDLPHLRNALSRIAQEGTTTCGAAHIEAHAKAEGIGDRADEEPVAEHVAELTDKVAISVRSASKREVDIRIMPWDTVISHEFGLESFARGAFEGTDPTKVLLMGLDHETLMGVDGQGKPIIKRRPIGVGRSLEERSDAAYMTFKVANTTGGDEFLALVADGVVKGASVEWDDLPGGSVPAMRNFRRETLHRKVKLKAVSPTWRPAYERAEVVAMRSAQGEVAAMADEPVAVAATPEPAPVPDTSGLEKAITGMGTNLEKFADRLEKLEEHSRSQFSIPTDPEPEQRKPLIGDWASIVLRMLSGEKVPERELHARTVQDLIISDNAGLVPEQFISEIRGVIDPSRPFMQSTRQLPVPNGGTTMRVPIITQRPAVAVQSSEKQELTSQKTIIGSDTFEMVSKGGVGDISLQLLKRSDPSFLDLYVRLLAEAYAIEAEDEALRALFDAVGGGVGGADSMDPENLSLGLAFQTSFDAIRRPPDTIWLSTEAVAAFIDAKATTTNQPLYGSLTTSATAAGGISGTISGLRAVHVPGLDAHGAFSVVGPSNGFAWAEDGTYTLQVDVPAKAGRDVAIFGMLWFVPWYPAAFTLYNVAS